MHLRFVCFQLQHGGNILDSHLHTRQCARHGRRVGKEVGRKPGRAGQVSARDVWTGSPMRPIFTDRSKASDRSALGVLEVNLKAAPLVTVTLALPFEN